MTKPKTAHDIGEPCFKVRLVIAGALLHVLSRTEPKVIAIGAHVISVEWDPIADSEHGDTIGFVRWADVSAITWRRA